MSGRGYQLRAVQELQPKPLSVNHSDRLGIKKNDHKNDTTSADDEFADDHRQYSGRST